MGPSGGGGSVRRRAADGLPCTRAPGSVVAACRRMWPRGPCNGLHGLDDERRQPDPDLIAFAQGDRFDPAIVDPRPVRAAEVREDQGPAADIDPGVVPGRPTVAENQAVLGSAANGERPALEGDRPTGSIGADL